MQGTDITQTSSTQKCEHSVRLKNIFSGAKARCCELSIRETKF